MSTEWKEIDGSVVTSTEFSTRQGPRYEVTFNYEVNGSWFGGTTNTDAAYKPGDVFVVQYDPNDPERTRLAASQRRTYLVILAVVVAVLASIAACEIYSRLASH